MNKQRLETLAHFLRTVPSARFDLGAWFTVYDESGDIRQNIWNLSVDKFRSSECGTTACAVGWACMIPEFRKAGLSASVSGIPCFEETNNWEAVRRFFEIDHNTASFLFIDTCYEEELVSPDEVADRIMDLVAGRVSDSELTA